MWKHLSFGYGFCCIIFFHVYYIQILEKEMATHSSILVWKIPWMEEPGGLQSMGSQRVRHDWKTTIPYSVFIIFFLELRFLNWKMRIITSTLSTSQRYFKNERQKAYKIAFRITKHHYHHLDEESVWQCIIILRMREKENDTDLTGQLCELGAVYWLHPYLTSMPAF